MINSRCVLVMAGITLSTLVGCALPGQRLLEARIEKDGQLLLQAQFAVPDSWDKRAAWQRLEGQSFESVGQWKPEPEDAGQVVLKGKVRLLLVHARKPFAGAEVEDLRLVADPANTGNWRLAPAEVSRTAKVMH